MRVAPSLLHPQVVRTREVLHRPHERHLASHEDCPHGESDEKPCVVRCRNGIRTGQATARVEEEEEEEVAPLKAAAEDSGSKLDVGFVDIAQEVEKKNEEAKEEEEVDEESNEGGGGGGEEEEEEEEEEEKREQGDDKAATAAAAAGAEEEISETWSDVETDDEQGGETLEDAAEGETAAEMEQTGDETGP